MRICDYSWIVQRLSERSGMMNAGVHACYEEFISNYQTVYFLSH
jgi:hypothetical protein